MTASARDEASDIPRQLAGAPVVLAAGSCFEGVLALRGPARIEGELRGQVVGPGPLWITAAASVEADLDLETVIISGRLLGRVQASARIELRATAFVEGDLSAPTLLVAEGCHWNGRSHHSTSDPGKPG